jgi:predicted PurR-regulated permease PerM
MSNDKDPSNDRAFLNRGIDLAIRLAVLAVIVFSCFRIFKPFLMPVVWAVIIAIAVYPLFLMLKSLAIVLVPTWMLTESLIDGTFASAGSCRKART